MSNQTYNITHDCKGAPNCVVKEGSTQYSTSNTGTRGFAHPSGTYTYYVTSDGGSAQVSVPITACSVPSTPTLSHSSRYQGQSWSVSWNAATGPNGWLEYEGTNPGKGSSGTWNTPSNNVGDHDFRACNDCGCSGTATMRMNSTSCSPYVEVRDLKGSGWTNEITVETGDTYQVRWASGANPESLQPAMLSMNRLGPMDSSHSNSGTNQSWGSEDELIYNYSVGGNCNTSKNAIVNVRKPADITRYYSDRWYFGGTPPGSCNAPVNNKASIQAAFHSTLSSSISTIYDMMTSRPAGIGYTDSATVGGRTIRVTYNVYVDKSYPDWCVGGTGTIWQYDINSTWVGPQRE